MHSPSPWKSTSVSPFSFPIFIAPFLKSLFFCFQLPQRFVHWMYSRWGHYTKSAEELKSAEDFSYCLATSGWGLNKDLNSIKHVSDCNVTERKGRAIIKLKITMGTPRQERLLSARKGIWKSLCSEHSASDSSDSLPLHHLGRSAIIPHLYFCHNIYSVFHRKARVVF